MSFLINFNSKFMSCMSFSFTFYWLMPVMQTHYRCLSYFHRCSNSEHWTELKLTAKLILSFDLFVLTIDHLDSGSLSRCFDLSSVADLIQCLTIADSCLKETHWSGAMLGFFVASRAFRPFGC